MASREASWKAGADVDSRGTLGRFVPAIRAVVVVQSISVALCAVVVFLSARLLRTIASDHRAFITFVENLRLIDERNEAELAVGSVVVRVQGGHLPSIGDQLLHLQRPAAASAGL